MLVFFLALAGFLLLPVDLFFDRVMVMDVCVCLLRVLQEEEELNEKLS